MTYISKDIHFHTSMINCINEVCKKLNTYLIRLVKVELCILRKIRSHLILSLLKELKIIWLT
jgi:hypothetical protein